VPVEYEAEAADDGTSDSSPASGPCRISRRRRENVSVPLTIEAVLGDITQEDVDVVVNAANSSLGGGGGVDGAIHRAAGTVELQAACRELGGCHTGDAKLTPGFGLRARYIAHAVGPVWRGGGAGEAELLGCCYVRCLALAEKVGAESIAFPAISTGIYGFPKQDAARIAVERLREAATTRLRLARLVAFDKETHRLYESLLAS
jgi:O-acetyl-ADP-ribose deacetylase (regulator of RNase III)